MYIYIGLLIYRHACVFILQDIIVLYYGRSVAKIILLPLCSVATPIYKINIRSTSVAAVTTTAATTTTILGSGLAILRRGLSRLHQSLYVIGNILSSPKDEKQS